MVNRAALILKYKETAVYWINEADPDPEVTAISLDDVKGPAHGIGSCILPSRRMNGWSAPGQYARPDHYGLAYASSVLPLRA